MRTSTGGTHISLEKFTCESDSRELRVCRENSHVKPRAVPSVTLCSEPDHGWRQDHGNKEVEADRFKGREPGLWCSPNTQLTTQCLRGGAEDKKEGGHVTKRESTVVFRRNDGDDAKSG